MKMLSKIVLGAAAVSTLAATPAAAQSFGRHDDRGRVQQRVQTRVVTRTVAGRNYGRQLYQARRWNRGERFDSRYANNYRVIANPRAYRLHDAPRGYRWVQSGNDAVLVALTSGLIGAVLANALH
jgi:Ni/Co efflux regulator RcnB